MGKRTWWSTEACDIDPHPDCHKTCLISRVTPDISNKDSQFGSRSLEPKWTVIDIVRLYRNDHCSPKPARPETDIYLQMIVNLMPPWFALAGHKQPTGPGIWGQCLARSMTQLAGSLFGTPPLRIYTMTTLVPNTWWAAENTQPCVRMQQTCLPKHGSHLQQELQHERHVWHDTQ